MRGPVNAARKPGSAPPRWSRRLYIRISPADTAQFKFLLESYGHLAYLSVVDRYAAVARISFSPDQESEVRDFLDAVRSGIAFTVLEAYPKVWP
ncbi:MAG: DUF4911 domain-containing protein [Thermodesulfobacteriota bacterium]|nr:DUF4911 domain-containing protein [Thermodesulfobacteriota bacterium]